MHQPPNPRARRALDSDASTTGSAPSRLVAGWDIGGAHLKCSLVDGGCVVDALQLETPLWMGLEPLRAAFETALSRLGPVQEHAVTMTGEISDLFEDREHGIRALVAMAAEQLSPVLVYAGPSGLLTPAEAVERYAEVASANWHATASLLARKMKQALLVDIGSSTTDLVPVASRAVRASGFTDAERLATGELVYTGATRTPVMAVCRRVPFAGQWRTLMAEYFATMADVYRLTGEIEPDQGPQRTADGRSASLPDSRSRLARMIGWNVVDAPDEAWDDLAGFVSEYQLAQISEAAALVLSRRDIDLDAPVVGAGSGRFLARRLADRLKRSYVDFDTLIEARFDARPCISDGAPACAVALLAAGQRAASAPLGTN